MNEIPLRDGTVAAAKPVEETPRAQEILLSDWTLAAVQRREEERRRNEREEKQRAKETFVSGWIIAFKQKEEEERRKKEQAAEAAVVTMKRAEVAEAKIVDEQAEAARRAKGEPREREEAELDLRAGENTLQRERKDTRAVPKSGIVRSRGTARMVRGVLSTLTTVAIASAIGFGAGIYTIPSDKAGEFRVFVNSKLGEINGLIQREWAAMGPKAKPPSEAAAPRAPETAPKEIQSAVPVQPAAEAPAEPPAGEASGQKDMPDANAAPPSAAPTESSNSQSAPTPSAEPAAPAMIETPSNVKEAPQAKPVAKKAPVAKPHPKPPVKKVKPKPKPKPAEHHPQAEPAEPTPPAEPPAQQ